MAYRFRAYCLGTFAVLIAGSLLAMPAAAQTTGSDQTADQNATAPAQPTSTGAGATQTSSAPVEAPESDQTVQRNISGVFASWGGVFTNPKSGKTVNYQTTNSTAISVGYIQQFWKFNAVEVRYARSHGSLEYFDGGTEQRFIANQNEFSGQYDYLFPTFGPFRPYLSAGGGMLKFSPEISTDLKSQTRPAFIYGVGALIPVATNFGLRIEYRGLLYKPPDFGETGAAPMDFAVGKTVHTAEPAIGVVFTF
jgi:opacity protein-like surface antigen